MPGPSLQAFSCTTGDTLGPHSPIIPITRYYNKDILHTTPSPLRVQHASMFMHMFLLRSGQFTKLGCLSSTRPMDKIGPHKTTSRKGRGSPLSPSPCLAPLKRRNKTELVESKKNSFIESPAPVQGNYTFLISDCTIFVISSAYVQKRFQFCGAN